jgi:uncharacterized protein (TIGR02598 family)
MRLVSKPQQQAFSLMETIIAASLAAMFLCSLFTMNMATMDTIRCAKENIAASQILQQRLESMRIANWHEVTDPTWLRDNLLNTDAAGSAPLKNLVEDLTLVSYGGSVTGNTELTRSNGVTSIVSQADLLEENAIKIIWTLNYTGSPNSVATSRQIVGILAKGGVAK